MTDDSRVNSTEIEQTRRVINNKHLQFKVSTYLKINFPIENVDFERLIIRNSLLGIKY